VLPHGWGFCFSRAFYTEPDENMQSFNFSVKKASNLRINGKPLLLGEFAVGKCKSCGCWEWVRRSAILKEKVFASRKISPQKSRENSTKIVDKSVENSNILPSLKSTTYRQTDRQTNSSNYQSFPRAKPLKKLTRKMASFKACSTQKNICD
jgi:hypothetical protein